MEFDDLRHFLEASEFRQQRTELLGRLEEILVLTGRLASDVRRVLQNSTPDQKGNYESLTVVREKLIEILNFDNASLFGTVGETFDAARHRVIETRHSEIEVGQVIEVESEGLQWGKQVVMKALVVVSRKAT
jgi:molecular chaperone GrpE (heat shock protein)